MSEAKIEQEIQAKGLNAPRLTPALIDAAIKGKVFHVFGDTCLTACCLTLVNGFTVTGESACASPENFNAEIGEKIAFEQARNKIWMLEGYLLKQKLFSVDKLDDLIKVQADNLTDEYMRGLGNGLICAQMVITGNEITYFEAPETTFTDRLNVEQSELREKLDKLVAFIGTELFNNLPVVSQELLSHQSDHMLSYLAVLEHRIRLL
jgi:hypothetical protein